MKNSTKTVMTFKSSDMELPPSSNLDKNNIELPDIKDAVVENPIKETHETAQSEK